MKRLFIAINLDETTIERLKGLQGELRNTAERARLVAPELLHITLAFLGDCPLDDLPQIIEVMSKISESPFALELTQLNYFPRGYSSLWFVELAESKSLLNLRSKVTAELHVRGIWFDKKPFRPHLTIARDVRLAEHQERDYLRQLAVQQRFTVQSLELMSSQRINGKLVYQVLHSHQLHKD